MRTRSCALTSAGGVPAGPHTGASGGQELLDLVERVRTLIRSDAEAMGHGALAGRPRRPQTERALLLTANGTAAGLRNTG